MNRIIKNYKTIQQSGNINFQSEKYNNSCFIINNFSDGLIFGISGLIPFNEAITRTNDHNLNKKQLYNLYINKNIKELGSINFGKKYSELSTNPVGRETLLCISGSSLNNSIGLIINNYNFKSIQTPEYSNIYFTNSTTSSLPNTGYGANSPADTELISNNKKILNKYINNNMFKDMSNKKKYAFLINNNVSKRIIYSNFTTKNYCAKKNTNSNSSNFNLN